MLYLRSCTLFFFICIATFVFGQSTLFKINERVCFIGNSITMNGQFYHDIHLYYATRFPDQKISIFNCGISGDVASGIINRMDSDILIHQPDWCVLMIGMNDVNRGLYGKQKDSIPGIKQQREQAIVNYKKNVEHIIKTLIGRKVRVILQKPSVYDQTSTMPAENFYGVNDALHQCGFFLEDMAEKYKLSIVDYWPILNRINLQLQQKDSAATIIGKDRVHPGPVGHQVMAYEFIKGTHADAVIAAMNIETKNGSKSTCKNCTLGNIRVTNKRVEFDCIERSIPYPIPPDAIDATKFIPIYKELDNESVMIKTLPEGQYKLQIDTAIIGIFSSSDLETGINLSQFTNTPQYQQAMTVLSAFKDLWKTESALRSIKYGEYKLLSDLQNKNDISAVQQLYLMKKDEYRVQKNPAGGFYESMFKSYMTNKPIEKELQISQGNYLNRIYILNRPIKHHYTILKIA
ncbi:SGNH/GDSL hydrolase family protein [uncultured Mucilaginibacter sp.]|uniref:SGNH/GDSL hydrolase family protein n=1 Tax=uncultured Mucilaginibacter sp. TaxID=797541 RepID=UPI0025DCB9DB|nr:SGNH/GDSL hydrolase family protein [uncultured Mucilaginibacter sp.]